MNYKNQIVEKITNNQEVVGIIGLGYVGLPLAVNFAEAGVKVIGFDKSEKKVNKSILGKIILKIFEMQFFVKLWTILRFRQQPIFPE